MTVTLGDCLCRNCAAVSTSELAADLMKHLEKEDLLCDQYEGGMEVGGGGGKKEEGGGNDDDDVTFVDARENLDDILGSDSEDDDVATNPSQAWSQGSQGLYCMCFPDFYLSSERGC